MKELKKSWPLFVPALPEPWQPLADVYRTSHGWLLKFDLAGVRLEDVTVCVRGRYVSVAGSRRDTVIEEGYSYYSMEISYSRFERTIEMPVSLDRARVALEAREGILMVRVSKGDEDAR